ncbi:T9SS type A sorting domain-containing protein [bacterium]|nr:T9SS type A sorting domain-containing protein [bacterium]
MRGVTLLLVFFLVAGSVVAQPDSVPVLFATADTVRGYLDMPDAYGNPAQVGNIWQLIRIPEGSDGYPPSLDPDNFGMPGETDELLASGRIGEGSFLPEGSRGIGFLLSFPSDYLLDRTTLRVFGSDTLAEGVRYLDSGLAMANPLVYSFMGPFLYQTFSAGHGGFLIRELSEEDSILASPIAAYLDPASNSIDWGIPSEGVDVSFVVQQGGLGLQALVLESAATPIRGWTSDFPPLQRNVVVLTDQVREPGEGRTVTLRMHFSQEELDTLYHGEVSVNEIAMFRETADGWELLPTTYSPGSELTYTTTDPAPFFGRFTLAPRWALGTDEETDALPLAFKLHPVYPSPFNPDARIRLDLPRTLPVRLEVFDILGRQVATLQDGVLPGGSHAFTFSGGHLASGTYFLRVRAGDHHAVQKMVLIR